MDNAHHVHLDGAVESELLGDTRHLVGCEHDAEAKEHVIRESEQAEKQKRCLHKRSQADRRYLFAPLVKAVGIPSGNAEHIQTSNRHLHKQNAAALDVLKENLDHAVGKSNQAQKVEKVEGHLGGHGKTALQYRGALSCEIQTLTSGHNTGQVMGECVLQADAEFVQFYRDHANQATCKKALQNIDACSFDIGTTILVFYRHVKWYYRKHSL